MTLTSTIDTVLDRSIALGYGNVGLIARKRLPDWPNDPPRLDGKTVLVTGAASGLGLAAAQGFARLGATVHALARNPERAADAVAEIDGDVRPEVCDVSSLADLRAFVERFGAEHDRLDVLVNNAGVMPDERELTVDGVELTFATQVLAPWVLIDGLAPLLEAAAPARVINVSSGGMYAQSIPEGDVQSTQTDYSAKLFYARTKRELMTITEQWAQKLKGTGVVVHAMHPGWADTKGVQNWMPVFRKLTRPIIRDAEQGADTIVWMGGAPEVLQSSGGFWHDRRARPTHYLIGAGEDSDAARREVWQTCERLSAGA